MFITKNQVNIVIINTYIVEYYKLLEVKLSSLNGKRKEYITMKIEHIFLKIYIIFFIFLLQ